MKKTWAEMSKDERQRFLTTFNDGGFAVISSTDPEEQELIDFYEGGIGIAVDTEEGWALALVPMFAGGGATQEEFNRNAQEFQGAHKPTALNIKTLVCELEP